MRREDRERPADQHNHGRTGEEAASNRQPVSTTDQAGSRKPTKLPMVWQVFSKSTAKEGIEMQDSHMQASDVLSDGDEPVYSGSELCSYALLFSLPDEHTSTELREAFRQASLTFTTELEYNCTKFLDGSFRELLHAFLVLSEYVAKTL